MSFVTAARIAVALVFALLCLVAAGMIVGAVA